MRESCTSTHFGLIRRKGVYPYDYMDSLDRFDETKLPLKDAFFRKLSGSPCSDSEYTHATRVLEVVQWQITTTSLAVGCVAPSRLFSKVSNSLFRVIRYIITPLLDLPGMLLSECHVLICNL